MSRSPQWKIYDPDDKYQGCMKEPWAAVRAAESYGRGSTVRYGHRERVWIVGFDSADSNCEIDTTILGRSLDT